MQPHELQPVLYDAETIRKRIVELVDQMEADCRQTPFVMIGILRGSFVFFADLVREIHRHGVHPRIDFMMLESYGSATESSGLVRITKEHSVNVEGASVILVDDILDTGRTLSFAVKHILNQGAASVKTCMLLDKPSRRLVPIKADYVGFTVDDIFVAGYGLDYDGYYRELPYISGVTFS